MTPPAGVVGGLLVDRYRFRTRLGAGGSGEVWRAEEKPDLRPGVQRQADEDRPLGRGSKGGSP